MGFIAIIYITRINPVHEMSLVDSQKMREKILFSKTVKENNVLINTFIEIIHKKKGFHFFYFKNAVGKDVSYFEYFICSFSPK